MAEALKTILQLVLINDTGDSFYRMRWPGEQLAKQSPNLRVVNLDARATERFSWGLAADLLVIYQSNDLDLLPLIEARKKLGKMTFVEYNDNFYAPPPSSPVFREWSSPLLWQSYELLMKEADGVIVTGPGLKTLLSTKTKAPVHILENHLPNPLGSFAKLCHDFKLGDESEIRIGWAGSLGHMADFLSVMPSISALLKRYPHAKLHLMGNETLPQLAGLPADRIRFTPWGGMQEYFEFWKPVHIGFAPLLDTPYNNCRSDIKAVEMAGAGVAPIIPDLLPYREFIRETGLVPYKDYAQLIAQVETLIAEPEKLRELAEKAFDYVSAKRIGPMHSERLNLFQNALGSHDSDFNWPVGAGYHELQGTSEVDNDSSRELKLLQEFIKAKQFAPALDAAEYALKKNPAHPDLILARARILLSLGNPEGLNILQTATAAYPLDLRFRLLYLNFEPNPEQKERAWKELLELLKTEPRAEVATFFHDDLIRVLSRTLRAKPELVTLFAEFYKIYPTSAALRFELAEAYRATGDDKNALFHFQWLKEQQEVFQQNQAFASKAQLGYLATWTEAIAKRLG